MALIQVGNAWVNAAAVGSVSRTQQHSEDFRVTRTRVIGATGVELALLETTVTTSVSVNEHDRMVAIQADNDRHESVIGQLAAALGSSSS